MSSDPHLSLWSHLHSLPSSFVAAESSGLLLVCPHIKCGPASRSLPFALVVPSPGMLFPVVWSAIIFTFRSQLKYHLLTYSRVMSTPVSDTSCAFLFLIALLTVIHTLSYLWVHDLSCLPKYKYKNRNLISCSLLCHQHLEEFLAHDLSVMNIYNYCSF